MNKNGFTLIEIMIVVLLIAAVVTFVLLSKGPGTESSTSLLTPSHELYKSDK